MKKFYSILSLIVAGSLSVSAQQLPNANFETWVDCVPWSSVNNTTAYGKTPQSWCISHVYPTTGSMAASGRTETGSSTSGRTGNAVYVNNVNKLSNGIPGYFTLGTTWSTSIKTGSNKDGGTWGGLQFTYRPDAVAFYYKSGTKQPTFVAYSWTGTYYQASVPGNLNVYVIGSGTATTCTMVNRERNIFKMATSQGGAVTCSGDTALIAYNITRLEANKSDWTYAVMPLTYRNGKTQNPEMLNIIMSADDYFSDSPTASTEVNLTVDDMVLLYYSRLASLSVNGTPIAGFNSDTYSYTIDSEMPAESAFAYTTLGNSGSGRVAISLDKENAIATLTVTNANAGGTDVDGATQHVYTLQFNKPQGGGEDPKPESPVYGGTIYRGSLRIYMGGDMENDITEGRGHGNVHIISTGANECTFVLPNFSLTIDDNEFSLGDIIVEKVATSRSGEKTNYTGSKNGMQLMLGEDAINCNVNVTGFSEGNNAEMEISVDWILDPDAGEDGIIPIAVFFNGLTYAGTVYDGTLQIYMGDDLENDITEGTGSGRVHIMNTGANLCTFVLPDFTLYIDGTPYSLGDILVENVSTTTAGSQTNYTGSKDGMELSLAGEPILCNVRLTGYTQTDGHAYMEISVDWILDADAGEDGIIPITVYFNGERDLMAIDSVDTDNNDAPVEWYNIQGMRVKGENLPAGIYIRRQGTDTTKILVK